MKKIILILVIAILATFVFFTKSSNEIEIGKSPETKKENPIEITYTNLIFKSSNHASELAEKVGPTNIQSVLAINRIDINNLSLKKSVIIPNSFEDPNILEFMPSDITAAENIPKLVVIAQRTQVFGFYENGKLVRSGPISSGKEKTPTENRLYFANWKGRKVTSTVNDEWVLNWNLNIDNNALGISLHQYTLPGYPASHSCVRFYEEDARWLYHWADEWILNTNGQNKFAQGTPVIIYGSYDFKNSAPWKNLPSDSNATKISKEEIEKVVNENLETIQKEQSIREGVLLKK